MSLNKNAFSKSTVQVGRDAKSRLSQLVDAVESGSETEIVIARNGKPVARLVPVAPRKPIRLGLAKGTYAVPSLEEWNKDDAEIAALFNGGPLWPVPNPE